MATLGKFTLSLAVKDIQTSLDFYEKLGFKTVDGGHQNQSIKDTAQMKWRMLENDALKIGLFQGMFASNILTFHPADVLSVQRALESNGIRFTRKATDDRPGGYVSALLSDPDGNSIMFDQI